VRKGFGGYPPLRYGGQHGAHDRQRGEQPSQVTALVMFGRFTVMFCGKAGKLFHLSQLGFAAGPLSTRRSRSRMMSIPNTARNTHRYSPFKVILRRMTIEQCPVWKVRPSLNFHMRGDLGTLTSYCFPHGT
jgi:hypothetical protein